MKQSKYMLALLMLINGLLCQESVVGADKTYVANVENLTEVLAYYVGHGNQWVVEQDGFLSATPGTKTLWVKYPPGEGDFCINLELALPCEGAESHLLMGGSTLSMKSGSGQWRAKGRFFRSHDESILIDVPAIESVRPFTLTVERREEEVFLSINGKELWHRPCTLQELGALGIDPGMGEMRLYTFSAEGNFQETAEDDILFGNRFGMQLRKAPLKASEVHKPVIVREAPTNECDIVERADGTLEIYHITKPESESISVSRSGDGGITWSESEVVLKLNGRAYYALQALEDNCGTLHVVYHIAGMGEGGYRGRLYDVYHVCKGKNAKTWSAPVKVIAGYVGSIRGFVELRSGRLLLSAGVANPERQYEPEIGPDYGWHDVVTYYSDNSGRSWNRSPDTLKFPLPGKNNTRYGAIEPVLAELNDGRIWMLARDRGGRLLYSYSEDGGVRWEALNKTNIISSDSPAELLRLNDGRLVVFFNACQFWENPKSYAMGGREVLHAAISSDEGASWQGFREILHESNMQTGGDRGTAYASAAESADGKVVVVSGQGKGKHAVVMFDPDYLEESYAIDDIDKEGLAAWTQYGDEGISVINVDTGDSAVAIPLKASGLCGASWNFPICDSGELRFKLKIPAGLRDLTISLNDHFNRVDDKLGVDNTVYTIVVPEVPLRDSSNFSDVTLSWVNASDKGVLRINIDGKTSMEIEPSRAAISGINYMRIGFTADREHQALCVRDLNVKKIN